MLSDKHKLKQLIKPEDNIETGTVVVATCRKNSSFHHYLHILPAYNGDKKSATPSRRWGSEAGEVMLPTRKVYTAHREPIRTLLY